MPILAAVGLILAYGVQAQPVGDNARSRASAAHSKPKPKANTPPTIPVAVQNDIHSIASALEAANKKSDPPKDSSPTDQYAKKNLDDQNGMAFWGRAMFWVGLFELIVTGGGVFLVWRTLEASWAAAREAKRAADAAENSLTRLERPQLYIEDMRLFDRVNRNWFDLSKLELQQMRPDVLYKIVNHGRTPAIVKKISGGVYIGEELPPVPTPNPNDVWTDEFIVPADALKDNMVIMYRGSLTQELLSELFVSRTYIEGHKPTRFFFFVQLTYESMQRTNDEIGGIWEYLVDIDRFIPLQLSGYSFRKLGKLDGDGDEQPRQK